jgi:hypothetical protein
MSLFNGKKNSEVDKQKQQEKDEYNKLKEEFKKLSTSEKAAFKKLYNQKHKEFEVLAKQELKKIMSDSDIQQRIFKAIKEGFEDGTLDPKYNKKFYNTNKLPKTCVRDDGGYWQIIDEEQEINTICDFICIKLAEVLRKLTGYDIDTGEGDEGSIYPEELLDDILFYKNVYKKQK